MATAKTRLFCYQVISTFFCAIVLLANIASVAMIQLPYFKSFSVPAGLLFYPLTFLLSDLVNEVYGEKKAKTMVYIAFAMSLLYLLLINIVFMFPSINPTTGIYRFLDLSGLRIIASLSAYIVSQLIGIRVYGWLKQGDKCRFLWARMNGATWISQLIDTILIDLIYLYFGIGMDLAAVGWIIGFSYAYKIFFSIVNTPLFYMGVFLMQEKKVKNDGIKL